MFTLCITTMDRYDDFLIHYLPKYIDNTLIDEIIITDENGNDIDKIIKQFGNCDKLKLIKNEYRLGVFNNKLKAWSYSNNEWIASIDSDNFADVNYFEVAKEYIENKVIDMKNIILAPSKCKPEFDFTMFNKIYNKSNLEKNNIHFMNCFNIGNFIINKYLIDNLNLKNEQQNIKICCILDGIFLNTLLFEQLDLNFHIVENLEYEHNIHPNSYVVKFNFDFDNFSEIKNYFYNRFNILG